MAAKQAASVVANLRGVILAAPEELRAEIGASYSAAVEAAVAAMRASTLSALQEATLHQAAGAEGDAQSLLQESEVLAKEATFWCGGGRQKVDVLQANELG